MKEWPSDPAQPIGFGDAIDPLKRALYHLYFLAPRHRSVDYDGYNIGAHELACTPDPAWTLSEHGIERMRSAGRSPADTILQTAFQLGIEQGRRMLRRDQNIAVICVDALLETCSNDEERARLGIIRRLLTCKS